MPVLVKSIQIDIDLLLKHKLICIWPKKARAKTAKHKTTAIIIKRGGLIHGLLHTGIWYGNECLGAYNSRPTKKNEL